MNENIVHLIDADTPQDMLDQLLALREPNERVLSLGPPPTYARLRAIPVEALPRPMGVAAWSWRRLAKTLPTKAILHVWSRELLLPAWRAARAVGGRMVCSLPHLPTGRVLDEMPWEMGQFGLRLTVPTERSRDELLRRRTDARRLFVLPPATQRPSDTTQRRARVRKALGLANDEVLILVPAEMLRGAGHDWACWAHAICREIQDRGRLILPGSHPRESRVQFFANTTGFGHETFFTGERFPREDAMAASDVAAFLYEQDLGLTALAEAMSAGLAILASRTPDLAATLVDGQTALLARPGDPRTAAAALLRLIEEPDLRERLARAAQAHAQQHFQRDIVRARLEEIYAAFD